MIIGHSSKSAEQKVQQIDHAIQKKISNPIHMATPHTTTNRRAERQSHSLFLKLKWTTSLITLERVLVVCCAADFVFVTLSLSFRFQYKKVASCYYRIIHAQTNNIFSSGTLLFFGQQKYDYKMLCTQYLFFLIIIWIDSLSLFLANLGVQTPY